MVLILGPSNSFYQYIQKIFRNVENLLLDIFVKMCYNIITVKGKENPEHQKGFIMWAIYIEGNHLEWQIQEKKAYNAIKKYIDKHYQKEVFYEKNLLFLKESYEDEEYRDEYFGDDMDNMVLYFPKIF